MSLVLLYGATGYSGRLIAEEAARLHGGGVEWLLGGRDLRALDELAEATGYDRLAFGLDDRPTVLDALRGVDVVLNAAGPFGATAPRLGRSALQAGCHYADLCGEVDVYRALDDLAPIATQRRLAMVCGAGRIATASDVLLDRALLRLKELKVDPSELSAVRVAHSQPRFVSRGSLRTSLRAIREQVMVVRGGAIRHVPVGQLERAFDFDVDRQHPERRRCIATATSLLDTLTALRTARRHGLPDDIDIESYLELHAGMRLRYELAAASAGALNLPALQRLAERRIDLAPEGPDPEQRQANRQVVVVELENRYRQVVLSAILETPDPYEFSARTALSVALRLAAPAGPPSAGWLTPAQVIGDPAMLPINPCDGIALQTMPLGVFA